MDAIDIELLNLLTENANQTATQLMKSVNLSIPAINKRLSKLKLSGAIKRFTLQLDAAKIGKPVVAHILVMLEHPSTTETFMQAISADRDIVECYAITGEYDYIFKVYAKGIEDLENKILELKQIPGVTKTHTYIALREYKKLPGPVPD